MERMLCISVRRSLVPARAAVNSLEDIAALVEYAHLYNARIYVTVNTILKDEELQETEKMIWALFRAGVDALIVQDMGITGLNLPPIPLHASTQMDNRTVEKVRFLADAGFRPSGVGRANFRCVRSARYTKLVRMYLWKYSCMELSASAIAGSVMLVRLVSGVAPTGGSVRSFAVCLSVW